MKTLNSSFSRRCLVPMRMSASNASKEAMMDSRRFVVSSAASCLFSWRLAVFIFVSPVEAAPLACLLVVRGFARFGGGSVRPVRVASTTTQERLQGCLA